MCQRLRTASSTNLFVCLCPGLAIDKVQPRLALVHSSLDPRLREQFGNPKMRVHEWYMRSARSRWRATRGKWAYPGLGVMEPASLLTVPRDTSRARENPKCRPDRQRSPHGCGEFGRFQRMASEEAQAEVMPPMSAMASTANASHPCPVISPCSASNVPLHDRYVAEHAAQQHQHRPPWKPDVDQPKNIVR